MTSDPAHPPAAPIDIELVHAIEERALNAWPALQTVLAAGWVLRFANGFTKRANSINALAPAASLEDMVAYADPLYAARGLPLIFRLSPLAGADADAALARLGFQHLDETIVMTAPIERAAPDFDHEATISARPSRGWGDAFAAANAIPAHHRATHDAMLDAIRLPVAFAALERDGHPIALGLAVAERGWVGLFDIVTVPAARRQGAARRLVTSLLAWGRAQGAATAYLQVVAANSAAVSLYAQLGFREVYRYRYRIRAR